MTSSLYVYGITNGRREAPSGRTGIGGAPLALVGHGDLTAVVSVHDQPQFEPTEAALWEHEAVCEALMETGAVLPAKFGLVFSEERRLRDELAARHDEFASALARVRGRVELGVRVLRPDTSEGTTHQRRAEGGGSAYLAARLAERRRSEELADVVHAALAPLAASSRRDVLVTESLLLSAAYLVDRERVDLFLRRIPVLESEHAEINVVCTGPWPPYNFVGESNDA